MGLEGKTYSTFLGFQVKIEKGSCRATPQYLPAGEALQARLCRQPVWLTLGGPKQAYLGTQQPRYRSLAREPVSHSTQVTPLRRMLIVCTTSRTVFSFPSL